MKQKGLAQILIAVSLLILSVIVLTPIPYYFNGWCDLPCPPSSSSCSCPQEGWYLGNPLWKNIFDYFSAINQPTRYAINITTPSSAPISAPESSNSTDIANWKIYTSQKKEFSFKYPNNWYFKAAPVYKDGPAVSFANEEEVMFFKVGDEATNTTWTRRMAKGKEQLIATLNNDQQSFDELKKSLNLDTPTTTFKGKQALKYATGIYILLDATQNRILSLYRPQYPDEGYLDQILSTFRFLP